LQTSHCIAAPSESTASHLQSMLRNRYMWEGILCRMRNFENA